ncbi:tetratricopeptide repeat protein [Rhizobiaceae bacterium n13]|uniref:Tetratricopeptide repeat protein n=1 Tax=Ferirhizobium litorale TaxID=2927786 RepID=A0AAE3QBK8_9HYPH|nr:tetratricopeptide repeat protein [Fererhizobium litorale]MDI7860845.1 tetratricopeptide repeat protein [Fererhizobium litorale]MDI7920993.1 tetratricopeptide repeat protein [Fererhizobium litorale]
MSNSTPALGLFCGVAAFVAASLASPIVVLAAGDGGSGGSNGSGGSSDPPVKTQTTTKCKDGKIWSTEKKMCVRAQKNSFNDDELYDAARELAYDGQYQKAIELLQLARNQKDPRILNYLGFANRKAGRMDVGMEYYREALKIDPDYILARSYMGEALLQQGDREGARVQLVEIRDRGGEDTWAYRALLQALNGYSAY